MDENQELREKLIPIISLLKRALERRVQAIEGGVLRVTGDAYLKRTGSAAVQATRAPAGALSLPSGRCATERHVPAQHPCPPLLPHVTFQVSGGLIGTIEYRSKGKLDRFRFYSRAGCSRVLRILEERGAISADEKFALWMRMEIYSLPDWAAQELEREANYHVAFQDRRSSDDGPRQGILLMRAEMIKEQHEWIM